MHGENNDFIGSSNAMPLVGPVKGRPADVGQQHDPAPGDQRLSAAAAAADASRHREWYGADLIDGAHGPTGRIRGNPSRIAHEAHPFPGSNFRARRCVSGEGGDLS